MKTAIIVPCFNEAKRLIIDSFAQFAEKEDILFCFVNDGSTDATKEMIDQGVKTKQCLDAIHLQNNVGKAEAVRCGINYVLQKYDLDYVGYWDGDLATPLNAINSFIATFNKYTEIQCVSGLRLKRLGAKVERKLSRHYLGRLVATIVSLLLDVSAYDTQCGAKLFKKELAQIIFKDCFISNWLFDVELFLRIKKCFGKEKMHNLVYEYPLYEWKDIGGSKLKFKDFILVPFYLVKIFYYYRINN